jgi:serine/threonine protein kinase
MEPANVEQYCNLLARSRLLTSDEVRGLHQRWRGKAGDHAADLKAFARWLVAGQYLTDYQANNLLRGHADRFFLNEYKLLEVLGKGRMAGVYKAVHRLGQIVAIKILPPSKAKDATLFGRFQREARLAIKLKHPNVVRTFQMGEANGLHYIVMEYLDGETLDDGLQRRKRLPADEAALLIQQALLGLQHLHEQGVVHRDMKPANLMLTPGHEADQPDTTLQDTVKILDVGLGRALFDEGQLGGVNAELTGPDDIIGTPDYMAPEQARDARSADIRADIYALGCVLYHCLTGQPPFAAANAVQKMIQHATEALKPVRAFGVPMPDGLQLVLDMLMAKDPARRFPTPNNAAQALTPFLQPGGAALRSPEADPRMRPYLNWLETQVHHGAAQPAAPIPLAQPVSPAAAKPVVPIAVPVKSEMGPVPPAVPRTSGDKGKQGLELNRRDWLLLSAGGVGVLLAVGLGVFLARKLRPKEKKETQPPETDSESGIKEGS